MSNRILSISVAGLLLFDIFVLTTAFDPPLKSSNELFNISGTVTGNIYNNFIDSAKVLFYTLDDLTHPLDSTYTDMNGFFTKDLVFTTNTEERQITLEEKAFPNPYKNSTSIQLNSENGGNYSLRIFNLEGKTLTTQNLTLEQGANQVNISGGSKGAHLITLTQGNENHAYKLLQTENTGFQFEATSTEVTNPAYKSAGAPDSLQLRFIANQYYPANINIQLHPIAIADIEMQQEPYEFTTTLKPFLETGEQVTTINPNFYVTIDWPQQGIIPGATISYPVVNGEINISRYMYPHNGNLGTAQIYNDTTDLDGDGFWVQNWSIGRRPHQVTNIANLYQNESSQLIPEQKTTITLSNLEGQIVYHYMIKNKAEVEYPGTYEDLTSIFTRGLITSSGNALSGMFIDLKPFDVADSLDIVKFNFNLTTGNPMEQWQLDRVSTTLDAMLQTRYLPNGDTLLPPHRVYSIDNFNDPRWQEVAQREFENSIYLTFYNGTPANGRYWTSDYSYNGHLMLDYAFGKFNPTNSNGVILAEIVSAITGETEPWGNLSPYVTTLDGLPTEYCKSISTIPVLLNLGTGQSWK